MKPIYEFECPCGNKFERKRSIKARPSPAVCPKCGGVARKIISRGGFILKGRGWARDGYK